MEKEISNSIAKKLDSLVEISKNSTMESIHGAGIICGNKMYSLGFNYDNRTKIGDMHCPSIHAEMDAIRRYANQNYFEKGKQGQRFLCV